MFWPRPPKPNPAIAPHDFTASFWSTRKWRSHLVHDGLGLLERRADRELDHRHQGPLVLLGEVAGRHPPVEDRHHRDDDEEDGGVARLPAEDARDRRHVAVAEPVEDAVEPEEERPEQAEAGLGRLVPLRDRPQERRRRGRASG